MITIDLPSRAFALQAVVSKTGLARFVRRASQLMDLEGTVEVLLTTDAEIRRLNRTFRGKNKATDVLSFPAEAVPGLPAGHRPAGDVAISLETAERQAIEHGHTLGEELRILLLHGLLHLSGMDHEMDCGEMAGRESQLRAKLRLPNALIARTTGPMVSQADKRTPTRKKARAGRAPSSRAEAGPTAEKESAPSGKGKAGTARGVR